jgi:hypothetical protein
METLFRVGAARSNESTMEVLWLGPELLLHRPGVLKGLGIVDRADGAELTLKMRDGRVVTRFIPVGAEPPNEQWRRKLNPLPGVTPPLFLSHARESHWLRFLPERQAVYVQVNNMEPDEDETLPQFGLRLRKVLAEEKPRNLILDLRRNNGGNSFSYPELLRTVVGFSTLEGRHVYALIGRANYSAAANFITDLERLARPILVGELTSGSGNQWGDESYFVLPYSGISGAFSGVKWQLSHPWDKRVSIAPEVPVQLSAKDYFQGRDSVLESVFRLMSSDGPAR